MKASPEPHHDDTPPDPGRQRYSQPAQEPDPDDGGRSFWTVLPGTADSPRRAGTAIRHMLSVWGMASLIRDTELMATELVTSAAESAPGYTIGFAISQHITPAGQPGITCEVYDRSAQLPDAEPARPGSEPGRGPAIIAALATDSGYTTWSGGKTAWFTLTTPEPDDRERTIRDHGLCNNGPAGDGRGHISTCSRPAARIAKDQADRDAADAEWEAGQ